MTKTHGSQAPTRGGILLMALYTFLLALGAAVPMAVSFQEGMAADGEGEIECGGYRAETVIDESDEDRAAERPPRSGASVARRPAATVAPRGACAPVPAPETRGARLRGS